MNLVDKILFDPITRGVKFLSRSGASAYLSLSQSSISTVNTADQYAANTAAGKMVYAHGTTYNGGIAPTITLTSGGGTLTSVNRSVFIPRQMSDGTWRIQFFASMLLSSATRVGSAFAVNGITLNSGTYDYTPLSSLSDAVISKSYTNVGNSSLMITEHASATTTFYIFSGEVGLPSKPTWAY